MEKNYEVSPNLIEQVQILLKKEAGVESLNSNDLSLDNSLQSSYLNEAIVGSSSSVDVLRCNNCEGELLRGSESIICVYCGHAQNQEFVRQPISFKSTFAFQWFLQSLGLDGFENVGVQIGGTQLGDRGRGSFKEEEIFLSDFLDLQLKWADDDSRGFGVKNEELLSGKRYLSLVGVDVEEILAQERRDHDASNVSTEQAVASKNIENGKTRISGVGSLSLFENMQSSEAASRSDWGADFQSAIPGLGHEKSANFSIAGAPSGSSLTSSSINFGSNLETGPPFNSKVSEQNSLVKGVSMAAESSASFEVLPVDQQLTTKENSPDNEKIDGDDSFGEWGHFSMSTSGKITQFEPSSTAVPGTDNSGGLVISDPFNIFVGSAVSKGIQFQNNTTGVPDDAWNTFITPSIGGDIHSQTVSIEPERCVVTGDPALGGAEGLTVLDGTCLEHQDIHVESTQSKISDLGDSIGLRSNDIHLGIKTDLLQGRESKPIAPVTSNEFNGSFDSWNDFKGSDNQQESTNQEVADNRISVDAWNDFVGLGVGKKEEQVNSLEVVGGFGNGNQSDSLAFDSWSDFTGSGVVSDSKPIRNDISPEAWNDFSSLMVTHANQPQSRNTRASENQAILEDDNLFSSWSDFRSSGTQTMNSFVGPNDTKANSDQISFQKDPISLKMIEDNTTLSSWGDSGGATSILEQQLQATGAGSAHNKLSSGGGDLFSGLRNSGNQSTNCPDNLLLCDGVTILDGKSTCENDDSFDAWSDFTSSSTVKANLSSSANASNNKEAVNHGDISGAWDVIVSSSNVEAGEDTAVAMGKTPEFNLFSPNVNSQYVGPNSLMQLDQSVGMFSFQNGSAPVPFSPFEDPNMVRTEHGDVKADGYVDRKNPSESASKETVAETLISEMHDLSFMLESGLSIPNSKG